MTLNKRHITKTITWRLIGSTDTFVLSWFISGNIEIGLKIGAFEIFSKMLLYYFHERFWRMSKVIESNKRHIFKTFSWRTIGTLDTILLGWLIGGNPLIGLKVGSAEVLSKMLLYYGHEKLWYKMNYGLNRRNKDLKNK